MLETGTASEKREIRRGVRAWLLKPRPDDYYQHDVETVYSLGRKVSSKFRRQFGQLEVNEQRLNHHRPE